MSRAPSPSPAVPPSLLPTITVALCASAKKHQQSFEALREAGERHNARLRVEQGCTVRLDPNTRWSASPSRPEGSDATATSASASSKLKTRGSCRSLSEEVDRSPASRFLFRFVNLNYDAQHHSMVICTDDAVKGEQPPTAHDEGEEGAGASASAIEGVDVVLHKVATFSTTSAIRALERWCKQALEHRSRRRKAPLVVMDPLEKVQLLMTRSMMHRLLNSASADGRPVALIPRTFMWDRPCAQRRTAAATADADAKVKDAVATPLGIHSFIGLGDENSQEVRANGTAQGWWWVAKPDESTGAAFTHHLVMWHTRDQEVRVPPAVQAALPKPANRFILQEFYAHALPVVVKVYCISPHVYIKVHPTVNLLTHLWGHTLGSTMVDVPVMINSQDRALFSAVASMSGTTAGPNLSQVTSSTDCGAAANEHTTTPSVPPQHANEGNGPTAVLALQPSDPAAVLWGSMIAPTELWDAFFAPGTPAHTAVSKLAQEMSGLGGIGLTMYGFDVLLVPHHLAHTYQRKSSRGIGHTHGATVKYEVSATTSPAHPRAPPAMSSVTTNPTAGAAATPASPLFAASEIFDLSTGAPTSLLLDSIPVVIDVNYFPGYRGVGEATQHMMELIAMKVANAKDGTPSCARRSHDASGAREKKHSCDLL